MSEPVPRRWRTMALRLAALLLGGAPALAAQPTAQPDPQRAADSLQALLVEARARTVAADRALELRRAEIGARRDQVLTAGGQSVRFSMEEMRDADTAAIARGLEAGRAVLVERFGEAGADFLRSNHVWEARSGVVDGRLIDFVGLRAGPERFSATSTLLHRPIDPDEVNWFVQQVAGERLGYEVKWLDTFTVSSVSLARSESRFAAAARAMSISWAAAGRRCATGVIAACELVMTPRVRGGPTPAWIDREDSRAAATSAAVPPYADSALIVDRKECMRTGDLALCERVLPRLTIRDPFSGVLRSTLVTHAIELGGHQAIERLRGAPPGTPLTRLAYVAGTSSDELLRGWQARTARAMADERETTFPFAASTLAWCALLAALTTRRRP